MHFPSIHLAGLSLVASSVLATNLYVSSYSGYITSLQLSKAADGSYALTSRGSSNGSAPSPTWLELNPNQDGIMYGLDEGLPVPDGSLASYRTTESGEFVQIERHSTIGGPVASIIYNEGKGLALAHYSTSSVTTWNILPSGGLSSLQNFTFKLSAPGTNPSRQDAPHPHEVILDPTDSFIVAPDLGADLLRVFSINHETSEITPAKDFSTPPGSGPRHGAFYVPGCSDSQASECLAAKGDTYFFLVTELASTVSSYKVTYGDNTLDFMEVSTSEVFGNQTNPDGIAAAEAIISPDNKYFLTSARNASVFNIPNFDSSNSTKLPSDALQSWNIDPNTGKLSFHQLSPAGGSFPRQFSVNKDGSLAAVGLQESARVVIIERNVKDGTFGKFVAEIGVAGEVTSVIWDE